MRGKVFQWLGREFVALSGEGSGGMTAAEQTRHLLLRFDEQLREMELSLDNTVRTRLWGRDRESRERGGEERVKVLSGGARSASSSYIAPRHFDSAAHVALDLLAMRPSGPGRDKSVKEYDPPAVPPRYVRYDSVLFLSGVTGTPPTLTDQVAEILARIEGSLADAGASWDRAAKVSCFLHRSQALATFKELFHNRVKASIPRMEYAYVDGYAGDGKLIEIEVTATL